MTIKPFKKGERVAAATITRRHGRHAIQALTALGFLESEERPWKRGAKQMFAVKKVFPADVKAVITEHFKVPIMRALDDAFSDIESLKEELEEWYGNLPESFQNGDKGEDLQSAIGELEGVEDFRGGYKDEDLERLFKLLPDSSVLVYPSGSSRSDRCSSACGVFESATASIDELIEDRKDPNSFAVITADEAEELKSISSSLDDIINTLQSVSFPGMY